MFFFLLHIMGGHKFSNPGHPFSCGVTLAKLAAVTMDEQGNETFDTSGALDKLRKVSCSLFHAKDCSRKLTFWSQIGIICLQGQSETKYLYAIIGVVVHEHSNVVSGLGYCYSFSRFTVR